MELFVFLKQSFLSFYKLHVQIFIYQNVLGAMRMIKNLVGNFVQKRWFG